jgi:putative hemolysin
MTIVILVILLIFLLGFDLLSVATRLAFTQTSQARLLHMREAQEKPVAVSLELLSDLTRLKATMNLILVLVRFLIAFIFLALVYQWNPQPPIWLLLVSLFVGAILTFGLEWFIDRAVDKGPEIWALKTALFARVMIVLFAWGTALLFSRGGKPQKDHETSTMVTEDDLKTLVDTGEEEGVFEQEERRMIYSIFRLGETLAREIMVPRIDMLALEVGTTLQDAVEVVLRSGHSRIPVYDETVDQTLGVLYAKELLRVYRDGGQTASLRELLRPAYFVPEAKHVDELLTEMQSQRIHIAIVVDEYGGVAGLVTLEDIVEEILGEIQDEYDQGEESPFQILENGDYLFLGKIDLDDFNDTMGSQLPREEADTLGGYIYRQLGSVPIVGETVQQDNLLLIVEQVSARRIRKVRARWLIQKEQPAEEEDQAKNVTR